MIWNLAPRSPVRVARDIARGLRSPGTLIRGTISFIVGVLLLLGGISLLLPLLLPRHALVVLATWTVLTGLLVDQVVGADLYGRTSASDPAPTDPAP